MNRYIELAKLLTQPNKLKALIALSHKGYFAERGWFNAHIRQQSVDKNNEPLPWVSYSFIDFIRDRITDAHHIFEYGIGNSTIFYASKAASVTSVEHDKTWFDKISQHSPKNAELFHCPLDRDGDYARKSLSTNKKFDLIIVDGRDRVNCCRYGMQALSPNGVIILDNSEREWYNPARVFLKENGFREIGFTGVAPGVIIETTTSVFYKPGNNCLEI